MSHRHEHESEAVVPALLSAYRQGIFPMAEPSSGRIRFYTADPRGVMPIAPEHGFHVPRSVERDLKRRRFILTADLAFERVMRACAPPRRDHDEPWINDELIDWYVALHDAGHAHSVEAWRPDPRTGELVLVGGIYGVSIGAAFFGESMFCAPRPRLPDGSRHPLDGADASKGALVTLARHLHRCGYTLFDIQMVTGHTARFGGHEVSADDYLIMLEPAVEEPDCWRAMEPLGVAHPALV
jgi:leucyl/phenylalanyl-tRNA--protein transferase